MSGHRSKDKHLNASRRRERIRVTKPELPPVVSFNSMELSRHDALKTIERALNESPTHPLAASLIDLFQIQGEELTEYGISYEALKVLEQNYPLLSSLS